RLGRGVEVEPGRAALGAGAPRLAVDLDLAHRGEVDDQPAVADAMAGGVVPTSAHGDLQGVRSCEVEGGCHVAGVEAASDHARPAVDQRGEAAPGVVVGPVGAVGDL